MTQTNHLNGMQSENSRENAARKNELTPKDTPQATAKLSPRSSSPCRVSLLISSSPCSLSVSQALPFLPPQSLPLRGLLSPSRSSLLSSCVYSFAAFRHHDIRRRSSEKRKCREQRESETVRNGNGESERIRKKDEMETEGRAGRGSRRKEERAANRIL